MKQVAHTSIYFPKVTKNKYFPKSFPFYHHAFAMIEPPQQRPSMTVSEKQHTIFFFSRTQELYHIVLESPTQIPLFYYFSAILILLYT
jgi:hypothetical protein